MVFCLMDKLLPSEKMLATGLNIFAKPNIMESRNLHRAGIQIDCQRANMGQNYHSIKVEAAPLPNIVAQLNLLSAMRMVTS